MTQAKPQELRIDEASLSASLARLARDTGAELLFDEALVRSLRGRPLRGQLSTEAALAILLDGTGIGYRRVDGAYILYRLPAHAPDTTDMGAIAEILVVGRRTQNADIRRTENDVQHYTVTRQQEIQTAHRDNLDQFVRSRLPANADRASPAQLPNGMPGATNSRIDLRGFGDGRTLVLVDGRRLPSLPSTGGELDQSDLNGVPLGAIDRIETLTSTAGGIYGPNAIGGVMNVILRRDYRGADFTTTSGISDRGDSARVRLDARLGFTPDDGRTDVMLFGSFATGAPLRKGQRDYDYRARQLRFASDPSGYLNDIDITDAIVISSARPLSFDAQNGGASLGSTITYLPFDFHGTEEEKRALLIANAGKVELRPAPGYAGRLLSLTNNARTISGLANIRRRFGNNVELFVDALYFQNRGSYTGGTGQLVTFTSADAPTNPFDQGVSFYVPTTGSPSTSIVETGIYRVVSGAIVKLSPSWQAEADFTVGATYSNQRNRSLLATAGYLRSLALGLPGAPGGPVIDPLGGVQALAAAQAYYLSRVNLDFSLANNFTEGSVRLAGPLLKLPAGPVTVTLLGEQRREHVPASMVSQNFVPFPLATPDRLQRVRSGYAEIRAPIVPAGAGHPLRGLELQLAVRYDDVRIRVPADIDSNTLASDQLVSVGRDGVTYTVGARFFPVAPIMLRTSYATGQVPPTVDQLQSRSQIIDIGSALTDPQRGNRRILLDGPFRQITAGSPDIRSQSAATFAAGAVFNPSGANGPRLSVDYSLITTRGEIFSFPLTAAQLLASEASYPGRVTRAPLTDADRAMGYTAGRVTVLDISAANSGRTRVQAVDFQFDWALAPLIGRDVQLYGRATWQPSVRTRNAPTSPWIEHVGKVDGLLEWRANSGVAWQKGPDRLDLNVQYYDRYQLAYSDPVRAASTAQLQRSQGSAHIPAQVYVDLAVAHRFDLRSGGGIRSFDLRFGIQNLFDTSPPIIADSDELAYSPYGDPRRRRFELALAANF